MAGAPPDCSRTALPRPPSLHRLSPGPRPSRCACRGTSTLERRDLENIGPGQDQVILMPHGDDSEKQPTTATA